MQRDWIVVAEVFQVVPRSVRRAGAFSKCDLSVVMHLALAPANWTGPGILQRGR